MPYSIA